MRPPARSPAAQNGPLPLSGIRVLDFSWVIAGPTTTRILAAMGAEVIKIEAPNGGDPGRASELHTVLGQGKKAIVLDLKKPEAVAIARDLAAQSDVLIENFATGVMDRLGLGAEALRGVAPHLIYVSASGLGRTGPRGAGGRLWHAAAMLCRVRRVEPPSRPGAEGRDGVAGSDVRPDAGVRRRRCRLAPAPGCGVADRLLDDRGDAMDDGGAAAGRSGPRRPGNRTRFASGPAPARMRGSPPVPVVRRPLRARPRRMRRRRTPSGGSRPLFWPPRSTW